MSSLLSQLPAPRPPPQPRDRQENLGAVGVLAKANAPPPYLRRAKFIPRKPEDFGDGGAFPEIHVSQYVLIHFRIDSFSCTRHFTTHSLST